MKRTLKKLTLSRETLRLLADQQVKEALGGHLLTYTCVTGCSNAQPCCA